MPMADVANAEPMERRGQGGDSLVGAIREEFAEMPCMRLTRAQFRRLWHLTPAESDRVVRELIASGYLSEDAQGRIGRAPQAH